MDKIEKRIAELRKRINQYNKEYYIDNTPSISDYDYDQLMYELQELESQSPSLFSSDSPSQRVGSDLDNSENNNFKQIAHRYPMLSLSNTYSIEELKDFANKIAKNTDTIINYSCELKFDGTAICLTYRNGLLVQALTRGDGSKGDDVLENIKKIKNIPLKLKGQNYPEEFEIRGEIYMPFKSFDKVNKDRMDNEEKPFANPRNAASGSIKLLDPKEVAKRGLECTLYHILGENLNFNSHSQALEAAISWGLPVSEHRKLCKNIDEVYKYILSWDTKRHELGFPTDGVVIKVDELATQKSLGFTSKFPKWAVAYKFQAERQLTEVLSIDYQVGRTGAVTPVANLDPVQLSGTKVKRATLNNYDQILAMDIRIGDYVYIEKGGEIIPKIVGVELSKRPIFTKTVEFPKFCPDCGTELIRGENEAKFFCPNTDSCPTQQKGLLEHFIARKAMNIQAGEATIKQLYDKAFVRDVADFYSLNKDMLLQLDSWKEKSADNLLKSIEASKNNSFNKVLFALGIRNVGEVTAKALVKYFKNIDKIASASKEDLEKVEDIGATIAESIYNFMHREDKLTIIDRLKKAGLNFEDNSNEGLISEVLASKSIVITGNFSISRNDMKALIESHGGKNSSSLSKNTAYLIVGEKAGPEKLKKAEKLDVTMLNEEEFMSLLNNL